MEPLKLSFTFAEIAKYIAVNKSILLDGLCFTKNIYFRSTKRFLTKIFFAKIGFLVKDRNFGQKSKFWSKIEILVKNRNFGQKSKFWSKIEIFTTNFFCKDWIFGQRSKFWSKIVFLVKNRIFGEKSYFW